MYKDITLSFMNPSFENMMEKIVKQKITELKNEILLQNSFSHKNNCNIEKEKQIMHASYDVSLEITRSKKIFLMEK